MTKATGTTAISGPLLNNLPRRFRLVPADGAGRRGEYGRPRSRHGGEVGAPTPG